MIAETISQGTTVTIAMAVMAGSAIMAWGITLALMKKQVSDNTKRLDGLEGKWDTDFAPYRMTFHRLVRERMDRPSARTRESSEPRR